MYLPFAEMVDRTSRMEFEMLRLHVRRTSQVGGREAAVAPAAPPRRASSSSAAPLTCLLSACVCVWPAAHACSWAGCRSSSVGAGRRCR